MDSEILHYSDMENSDDEELEDTTWMDLLEKEEQDYKSFYKENVDVIKIFYTYVDNNNNKNHKLISILQYNIDLEPEDVLSYLKFKEKYNFLTIVSKINDILWNDTISIFKNLNSLHIVYYEEPIKKSSNTKKVYIRNKKLKRNKHTRKRT